MSVDKNTLYSRYGQSNNPFIAPPMLITPRYFHVFSLTVTARQAVTIRTDSIELFSGADRENPDGVEALIRFWHTNGGDETPTERKKLVQKEDMIRHNLLPSKLSLVAGESYTGYIIFISHDPSLNPEKMMVPAGSPLLITLHQ